MINSGTRETAQPEKTHQNSEMGVNKQHTAIISLGSIQRSLRSSKSRFLCPSFQQTPQWAIGSAPHGLHTSFRSPKTETNETLSIVLLWGSITWNTFQFLHSLKTRVSYHRNNFRIEFPPANAFNPLGLLRTCVKDAPRIGQDHEVMLPVPWRERTCRRCHGFH